MTVLGRCLAAACWVVAWLALTPAASAEGATGEIVVLNWMTGSALDLLRAMQSAFRKHNPGVEFRTIDVVTQGDQRGGLRAAILGGEKADLLINTWPAFRKELVDANLLRPLDAAWAAHDWSASLTQDWRGLGETDGVTYGLEFNYADRSGLFYRPDVMRTAGIEHPPATWAAFVASFAALNAAHVTPIAIPAKSWAHAEWFESLLLRLGGVEAASRLAAHQTRWTDPIVVEALRHYAELLKAGCCDKPSRMLATDADDASRDVLQAKTHGYVLVGTWINATARMDYHLREGLDYSLVQLPPLGLGHDDTSSISSKEFLELSSGPNPAATEAFLDWTTSAEAADLVAASGFLSPNLKVDQTLYGPVSSMAAKAVAAAKPQFVLGDLLPGDLVDEYRVQLQRFVQDPSDATIAAITTAIEAKAKGLYK